MKAMIFGAGLGTRFKPWTDRHPKVLALVNGKSLLQRAIEYLQHYGIYEVIINVHHFAGQIVEAIELNEDWGSHITISDETAEVLETGGGLKKAAWYFDQGAFIVMNADILTDLDLSKMIAFHEEKHPLATLAVTERESSRYLVFSKENLLCGWHNVLTGVVKGPMQNRVSKEGSASSNNNISQKAFSGIHIIDPRIFPLMTTSGKFSIIDLYLDLCRTEKIQAFDHSGSKFIDVGKPGAVALAESLFP